MPKRGGKRTKKRTHVLQSAEALPEDNASVPRSMVIRSPRCTLPHTLQVLQTELRKVMSPNTAQKLKEKKNNTLKDYTHVAGLMKVTHFMFLSPGGKKLQAEPNSVGGVGVAENVSGAGALLKIARFPQGPTLTFRINRYSLCRHVRASQKKSYDVAALYNSPPLVVLNNFGSEGSNPDGLVVPAHIKLMRITFQNMFPALDVATVKLTDCRRVVLFSYDKENESVEMRHYMIRANPIAVSKPIKRVICASSKQLPDLGHLDDISDWLLRQQAGDASDSEAEEEDHVILPQKIRGRGNHAQQQAAVKLSELGPRINMKLQKVERGFCEGDVMHHAIEKRTPEEVARQRIKKSTEEAAKRKRREEQEANVARKTVASEEARASKRSRFHPREPIPSENPN